MKRSDQRGILLVEWAAYAGLMAILVSIGAGFINNTLSTRNKIAATLANESLQALIEEHLADQMATGINGSAPGTQALTDEASVLAFLDQTLFAADQSGNAPAGWAIVPPNPHNQFGQGLRILVSVANKSLFAIVEVFKQQNPSVPGSDIQTYTVGVLVYTFYSYVNFNQANLEIEIKLCRPIYVSQIIIDTDCQTLSVTKTSVE